MITRRSDPRRVAIRRFDEGLAARVTRSEAQRLADTARRVGPVVGVALGAVVAAVGGFSDSASIWLAGTFAGLMLTVGVLYPLPHVRSGRG